MLAQVQNPRRQGAQIYSPHKSALLVLDMQNFFLCPDSHAFIPSGPAIVPAIQILVNGYHRQRLPVYFTRHTNTPENAKMMAKWWRDLIDPDDPISQVIGDFDRSDAITFEKHHYDAFYETDLEQDLWSQGVEQIVICGVMTHLCCETTARSGFMRGFEVFFTVDGTATYNEAFHLSALITLSHGFAVPVLAAEILEAL
jgi:isochorismate hydrolase